MISMVKRLAFSIIYRHRSSSKKFTSYLNNRGCKIDSTTYFFDPVNTKVDISRPYLLEIGKFCKITSRVHFLTHDYSTSVIRYKYKEIYNTARKTTIGDNVFIGINSIILPGVTIGDNVIVAAGSVVSGKVGSDQIIGGNPAKKIMSLDEYKIKIQENFVKEAFLYAKNILINTGSMPSISEMDGFYPLYSSGLISDYRERNIIIRCNGDDYDDFNETLLSNTPIFNDYSEFIDAFINSEFYKDLN